MSIVVRRSLLYSRHSSVLSNAFRAKRTFSNDETKTGVCHYKGGMYRVTGNVLHADTGEKMVLYSAIDPSKRTQQHNPRGLPFVLDVSQFTKIIVVADWCGPRFRYVGDAPLSKK